jgi:hypothetical protein
MRPLIRIAFTLFFLCLAALNVFGDGRSPGPVIPASFHYHYIKTPDSLLSVLVTVIPANKNPEPSPDEASVSRGRICSCQILNLESSNYDHRYVVLLAEKTNDESTAAFNAAKNRIRKERKRLKEMFYDKIKTVAELHGTGSCKSMFFRLKTADSHLQLYEILNAD